MIYSIAGFLIFLLLGFTAAISTYHAFCILNDLNLKNDSFLELFLKLILILFYLTPLLGLLCAISSYAHASSFNSAIPIILKHEGKLSEDPSDKGGITNYGISLRYVKDLVAHRPDLMSQYDLNHQKVIDDYDIANMTISEAEALYRTQFWDKTRIGYINSQDIATKVFDMSVNMGSSRAIKILQESCGKLHHTNKLAITGMMDDDTLSFINGLNDAEQIGLLKIIRTVSCDYYRYIATRNPAYKRFLKGWLRRAYE